MILRFAKDERVFHDKSSHKFHVKTVFFHEEVSESVHARLLSFFPQQKWRLMTHYESDLLFDESKLFLKLSF